MTFEGDPVKPDARSDRNLYEPSGPGYPVTAG